MGRTLAAIGWLIAVMALLYFRRPLTRLLMRGGERQWGLRFEQDEPSTWFIGGAGVILLVGGACLLWEQVTTHAVR
jgi:hypothetical protein